MLHRANRAALLDIRRAELAKTDLRAMPMRRASHLPPLARCWELRDNVSTCDALGEALGATLLSGDRRPAADSGCWPHLHLRAVTDADVGAVWIVPT